MNEEIWKPIPGFDGYEASDQGRVRSLDKIVFTRHHGYEGTRRRPGKMLALIPNRGYLVVSITVNGKSTVRGAHQLVALAFHGLPPEGYVVDHVNTDRHDNRPDNLEHVTNAENVRRQYAAGLLSNKAGEVGRYKDHTLKASRRNLKKGITCLPQLP